MQAASHGGLLFHARVVEIAKCEREGEDARHVRGALPRALLLSRVAGLPMSAFGQERTKSDFGPGRFVR
jgi:hypothetical protein